MQAKMKLCYRSAEGLIRQLTDLPVEINKLDWLKTQNIDLMTLNYTFGLVANQGQQDLLILISKIPGITPEMNNNYAIRMAAKNGHLEAVQFLCTLPNVDPAAENNYAIGLAATHGYLDVVQFLCSHPKVDPAADNDFALRRAANNGFIKITNYLASLPCYNPFLPHRTLKEKKAIIALLCELKLESVIAMHHLNANPNLKFMFFHHESMLCNLSDVKQMIVQTAIDLDNR